ncbi:MAG TPA: 2-oxoglutarate dehydrogenase complex dihydrolipoyllysine-residue succinyltransferase [Trueperaceae bacterium]|nr:2-oxoglutarate dehydrogenase complex dihydrolipoyllysine-residue succinyltransferase [Trueperaceae bacterium]
MATDVKVPAAGESISEVFIGAWLKQKGDTVAQDEALVEVETDKATLEVPSPVAGVLTEQLKSVGDAAAIGEVIARIDASGAAATASGGEAAVSASAESKAPGSKAAESKAAESAAGRVVAAEAPTAGAERTDHQAVSGTASQSVAQPAAAETPRPADAGERDSAPAGTEPTSVLPAAQRLLDEHGLVASEVRASGLGGRLLKEDVQAYLAQREHEAASDSGDSAESDAAPVDYERQEETVPMSPLRRKVAERLVAAQHAAALLTTFNEIDMTGVIELRKQYKEPFEKRYGVRLGFMSFFVKAAIDALKQVPQLNAEIRGTDIVYKNYYDIGVAVSAKKGLVVPVIRDAERLSFAEVERIIGDFGERAGHNKLMPEELQGGTFTISNGGVFGSLMSTPIVNPPQSGVLGMHAIQERPVAREGQVVIRPMMYVALTYDHRIIDGREAVTFLKRIKDAIENPTRMLLEV